MIFFSASLALRSVLEILLSPTTELVVMQNLLFMACHKPIEKWFIVVVFLFEKMTLQVTFFFFWSAHEALTYRAFSPFQFAPNAYDHGMVNTEFFVNFSGSCKRIGFDDGSQLVIVNFQWLATVLLIFKALVSFANFLNPHCTAHSLAVPGPSVLIRQVVSAAL